MPASLFLCNPSHGQRSDLLGPFGAAIDPAATFGELAPGVFHSGVDVGVQGLGPVSAAGDGEIVRVRVSGGGYGRSLHLLLADGREIVYGHLREFSPEVEDSCLARQWSSGEFELDWRPAAGTFPIARGAWIGRAGQSVDGRPILHVEVRIDGVSRNPLRNGFRINDRTRPVVAAVRFVPLGPDARIDGRLEGKRVPIEERGGTAPGERHTVLWGGVGVECESYDPGPAGRRGLWTARLDVDGARWFESDLGGREFAGGWIADLPEVGLVDPMLQRLYLPGERDRGRLTCGTGIAPGHHTLRIIVIDCGGRADTVSVPITVRDAPQLLEWIGRPIGRGDWDLGVRLDPPADIDPEAIRLWADLTEDAVRYPVRSRLGHMGKGWFLGELSSFKPSGPVALRVRIALPDGREFAEPIVSLDQEGNCAGAVVDSPLVTVAPRWLEVDVPIDCFPVQIPRGRLIQSAARTECALLDTPEEGGRARWRFVSAPRSGPRGEGPSFEVELDGVPRRWRLGNLAWASAVSDLIWNPGGGALTVEVPAGTFYGPVWLGWSRFERDEGPLPRGEVTIRPVGSSEVVEVLIARSDGHRVDPVDLEMDGPLRVSLRPSVPPEDPGEARRLGIYGRSGPGRPWTTRGGLWTGSAVVAVVSKLEEWILLEDRSEPWIYAMEPAGGSRTEAGPLRLSAQVREDGSGIDPASIDCRLDGRKAPAALDPVGRRITIDLLDPPEPGAHEWSVGLRDRAGNESARTAAFWVQERP